MAGAKQIRDEIMKMTIVVNSNPAQQEIYALTEANRKFAQQSKDLRDERVKVGQTLGKNSQEYKDLTSQINSNSTSVTSNNRKIKELGDSLDISQMSVKQLKQEAILLRKELDRVVPGSDQYNALQTQLGGVNTRLAEVRNGAQTTGSSFSNLATEFNHYSGLITAGVAILYGFAVSVNQIIDRNNKMADAMTAVEKTTGLAKDQVEDLTKSFGEFDTRTARIDLLKIAEIGGRLGVAKGDIKDFTQEVDKAYVALGDGFAGGVEAVANKLGKIKGLFKETKDLNIAVAMNQIGSSLNELGAAGAASEENISDFTLRVGALPNALKPTIGEAMALGAAFEESGIEAERAGTAYTNLISTAALSTDKFAKVMRITTEEAKKLINTNPTEFFLKFSESLKGMDATGLAKTLDYLKLNDQYVKAIVGSASENTDRFRQSIDLSNKSLSEATSLQNEFNKVNNNAAAIYEKTQKKLVALFTSKAVADFINNLVGVFGKFIGAVEDSEGTITGFRNNLMFLIKVIALMIAATLSYNIVTGVYNGLMVTAYQRIIGLTIVEKARNTVMLISNGIATLYRATLWLLTAGYSLLTGNVAGATFAMRGFTAAIMENPLGAILGLIALAASAYFLFSKNAEDATKKQKSFNSVMQQGTQDASENIAKLQLLYKTATNVKLSTEERLKAVKKLKEEFPGYFSQISDEIIMNGKATKSYNELRTAIIASARSKAAEAELQKREGDRFTEDEGWKSTYAQKVLELAAIRKEFKKMDDAGQLSGFRRIEMLDRVKSAENTLKDLEIDRFNYQKKRQKDDKDYIDAIDKNNKLSTKLNPDKSTDTSANNFTPPDDKADKEAKKEEKAREREAARLKREEDRHQKEMDSYRHQGDESAALARQIQLDIEDAKIEAMAEGFDKELAALNLQEKRKLEEIDKKEITKTEFNKIDEKIATAKGDDKKLFEALKASWVKNNADLEIEKTAQKIIFEQKRKTLNYKFETEELKKVDEDFQTQLGHLERQKNEELAKYSSLAQLKAGLKGRLNATELREIKNWNDGKKALDKVYQQEEIQMQMDHLQTMLKLYEGLDLSVLTKEQRKQVLKFIDDAGNELAKLGAKKKEIANGESGTGDTKSKLGNRGSTDILGMNTSDWKNVFDNIKAGTDALGTVQAAVQALQAAFGEYYKYIQAQEQQQSSQIDKNAKKKEDRLKKMLSTGQINQEQYEKEIQKLNDDTDQQKQKLEYESAKRQKAMAIAQTIINTAQAIMGIWKDFPKADFGVTAAIMSGVVGAIGLAQVATIASQPLPEAPGYEQGFGTEYDMRREQDGKQFRVQRKRLSSGLVNRPTHFIAGENGVEMVIDSPTYAGFRPEVKRMLHQEISYSRGYEGGLYPQNNGGVTSNNDDKYMMIIQQNTEAMNAILGKKFVAYVGKTMENAKEIIDLTDEYSGYKNASKK